MVTVVLPFSCRVLCGNALPCGEATPTGNVLRVDLTGWVGEAAGRPISLVEMICTDGWPVWAEGGDALLLLELGTGAGTVWVARLGLVIGFVTGAGGGVFDLVGIPMLLITTGAAGGTGFGASTGIWIGTGAAGATGLAAIDASLSAGTSKTAGGAASGAALAATAAPPAGEAAGLAAAGLGAKAGAAAAASTAETLPPEFGIDAGGRGKGWAGGTKPLPANGSRRAGADLRLCTGGAAFSAPSNDAPSKSTALRDPEVMVNEPVLAF